jgi:hypothetical protein
MATRTIGPFAWLQRDRRPSQLSHRRVLTLTVVQRDLADALRRRADDAGQPGKANA